MRLRLTLRRGYPWNASPMPPPFNTLRSFQVLHECQVVHCWKNHQPRVQTFALQCCSPIFILPFYQEVQSVSLLTTSTPNKHTFFASYVGIAHRNKYFEVFHKRLSPTQSFKRCQLVHCLGHQFSK